MKPYEAFDPAADYSRHEEIRALVDSVVRLFEEIGDKSFREYRIFLIALGDTPDMHVALSRYLLDVATCPTAVILWCQETLRAVSRPRRIH